MSKALVIKGANFSANRVETITISTPIPCTGISLSQTEIVSPAFGSTIQLTATLTPADTTESVIWTASNDAATVNSSGLVTIVGVGDVTITAQCGTATASCSIRSISQTINIADLDYSNVCALTSTNLSADPPKDFVGVWANQRARLFYDSSNPLNGYIGPVTATGGDETYPIALPKNTSSVEVTFTGAEIHAAFVFCNANKIYTYPDGPSTYRSEACRATSSLLDHTNQTHFTETVPNDTNAFMISATVGSGVDITTAVIGGTITFS